MAKRKSSKGYTAKQTGSSSSFGASGASATTQNPWGTLVPHPRGRGANAVGTTTGGKSKQSGSSRKKPTPDSSLFSISYPLNDPRQWPIVKANGLPDKRSSPTAPTTANANRNNAIVNYAYTRDGYV